MWRGAACREAEEAPELRSTQDVKSKNYLEDIILLSPSSLTTGRGNQI